MLLTRLPNLPMYCPVVAGAEAVSSTVVRVALVSVMGVVAGASVVSLPPRWARLPVLHRLAAAVVARFLR